MNIRPFKPSDQEAVVNLWKACGLVVPHNDPVRDIQRKLKINPELFLVGEKDGKVMASCMVGYEGHRGWINYLAVVPEQQNRGYAREIMRYAEQLLLEVGCPKVNLQIRSSNTMVIAFYESLGYKMDEAVSMGKRLIPDH